MRTASVTCGAWLVLLLACTQARAQAENPVLVYCDDGDVGLAAGSCATLAAALQKELTDFYLTVVHVEEIVDAPEGEDHVPAGIAERTRAAGALFSVWFSRAGFSPGKYLILNIYDPSIEQTISRTVPALGSSGGVNQSDVAFHTRIIMGASLYSDIDSIQHDENLVALAIPEETAVLIEKRAPARRTWLRLQVGYLFTGYPMEQAWYHGLAWDLALVPVPRLEVFLDGGAAFLQDKKDTDNLLLDNTQVLLGLGARFDVVGHHRIGLLPAAGFHLGISLTRAEVYGEGEWSRTRVNPALWAGLELRVHIVERVSLVVGLRFENLFRYEVVHEGPKGGEHTEIFRLSQFRFGSNAMICIHI
jgi:hypothetical protein